MADQLTIYSAHGIHLINLLTGTYKLRDGSWVTSTPQTSTDYGPVPYGAHPTFQNFLPQVETMDLIAQDTTHSTIRAGQQNISEALETARLYNQHPLWTYAGGGPESVWLVWNIDGETQKQSLIYEGSLTTLTEECAEPFIDSDVSLLRLALIRHPFWEPVSVASITPTVVSAFGGTYEFNGIRGDVWARFSHLQLYGAIASGPLYRVWVGIREEMAGMNHFESVWELDDGTTENGAAAGGGYVTKVAPASSLTRYVYMSVAQACTAAGHSDYHHQIGEYLVLCRCRIDSGTVGLQMRVGYSGGSFAPSEEVFVDDSMFATPGTSWRLIELGRVQLPPIDITYDIVTTAAQYATIAIYAEQVDGASTLDLDALILVPTHHFWQAAGANITNTSDWTADLHTSPNDKYACYGRGGNVPRYSLEYSIDNMYLPIGDSIMVVAGERETSHVAADNVGVDADYYLRWGMYRGT